MICAGIESLCFLDGRWFSWLLLLICSNLEVSMSFIFKCPNCQQPMNCEDDWDGLVAQCPKCDREVTLHKKLAPILCPVPPPEQKLNTPPAGAAASQAPSQPKNEAPAEPGFLFICPECGSSDMLSADKQGKTHICHFCGEDVIALPTTTRKCPFCGETIKIAATICKKCHKPVPPIIPRSPAIASGQHTTSSGSRSHNSIPNNSIRTTETNGMSMSESIPELPMSNPDLRRHVANLWDETKRWAFWLAISLGGAVVSVALTLICNLAHSRSGEGFFEILFFLMLIFAGVSCILFLIKFITLFHQYWTYIGTGSENNDISPGAMVGFCFIPLYGLYWNFIAIWGLAKRLKAGGCDNLNPNMALSLCITNCCLSIFCWVPFLSIAILVTWYVFFSNVFGQFNKAFVGTVQE